MGLSDAQFEQIKGNQRRAAVLDRGGDAKAAPSHPRRSGSEAELERICTNILIQDGWRALKTNPVSRRAHGKGFGEVGMADYLYMRYGGSFPILFAGCQLVLSRAQVMWIEWKREKGGVVADHQHDWHTAEREKGALVLVAGEDFPATMEGWIDWYQRSGLMRGNR